MNNHTPGPWQLSGVAILGANPSHRVGVIITAAMKDAEQVKADARMIAAAPELLAALTELVAEHDAKELPQGHYPRDTGGMELARNAIAKATPT